MSSDLFPFAVWLEGTNQNSIPANDNALRNEVLAKAAISIADAEPSESDTGDGDVHIVGTPWGGFDSDDVVIYRGGTWYGFAPFDGWLKRLLSTGQLLGYDSSDGWAVVLNPGGGESADQVSYDNASSGLAATDVQAAIDELVGGSGIDPTFLRGLRLVWVAADAIDVEPGGAYIESTGLVLNVPAKISVTGLSFSAATWYHVYLYSNAGTPAIELSTTAPATPYYATARSKTGDATRRYIGSVLTNSTGTPGMWRFVSNVAGGELETTWVTTANTAPWRVLSAGTSTTPASVSIASMIPGAGIATRIAVNLIMGIVADGVMTAGVGETLVADPYATLSAEVYAKFGNALASLQYFYLPAAWVTIRGAAIQYAISSDAGVGNKLYLDLRGYAVAR